MKRLLAVFGVLGLLALAALAQDVSDEGDSGFLLNLLENRLSAPGRQIRLHGISGALSSQARVERITISDAQGVWLEIDNAEIDWSRLALLRGRVAVNRLSAARVAWLRRAELPPPARRLPQAEARPFSVPQLPLSIQVSQLEFPDISFDQSVFGQAAELALTGAVNLARGVLDTSLEIQRRDGPGGALTLQAGFSNESRQLSVDLDLHEPEGGVVATLLRIEGTPAIDLNLEGSGPLDEVDLNFTLDAAQQRVAQGLVALRSGDEGLGFNVDFSGGLSPLIPPRYRDFFAGDSVVQALGVAKSAGGFRIDRFSVAGAELDLDGDLETGADNFLRNLTVSGTLGDPAGPPVLLPVPGGGTYLQSAALHINYGDATRWNGFLVLDRLQAGGIEMEDVTLRLGGLAQNLDDPGRRNITLTAEGLATGVWSPDPETAQALGTRIDLFADVSMPPDAAVTVRQFQVSGNGLSIFSAGQLENLVYTGRNSVRVADIAIFAGLADRPLSGGLNLRADGSVSPLSGGFDLALDGTATDLAVGDDRLDRLLAGTTAVSGRAVRDESGFRTEDLRVENPQLSFASNGSIATARTDIGFEAALTDLALVDPRLQGALTATGRAFGAGRPIAVSVSATVPSGRVSGHALTNARIGFDGRVDGSDVTGDVEGAGALDGLVLSLAGGVAVTGENRSLSGLDVRVGPNRLTGNVARSGTDPITGELALTAPDIAPIATLALAEATGAIDATIRLHAADVGQGVDITAQARDVVVGANRVGSLDARAQVSDALGLPLVNGTLESSDLVLGGTEIASLAATGRQTDATRMQFTADARLAIGTLADLSGELQRLDDGFAARLDSLSLRQQGVAATLMSPATVTVRNGSIDLTPVRLDFGTGNLTAEGRIGDSFDVGVTIAELPLALANAVRPDLGVAGQVNGTARITGPRASPDVRFTLAAAGVSSAMTRGAGLPPVALNATGTTADGRLNLDASIGSQAGLAGRARGSVPLGPGNLDLTVDLASFPLALVDRIAGGRGLRGTVSGQARITGPLADPAAEFDLRGESLTMDVLAQNGIPPLGLTGAGSYRARSITLRTARATGGGGLDLTGSGRIPFAGPGLDVSASGTLPLAVFNPLLEERAAQAAGLLRLNATARGSLAAPQLSGDVSLSGGTFVDPEFNLRLQNVSLDAGLEGNAAVLRSFQADVATGGRLSAQGRVTLNGAAGFPADLSGRIDDVRYTDGAYVSTRLNGELSMTGPLVGGGGLLAGRIDLGRTEISIAEGLGASAEASLEQVEHVSTPRPVQITLDRARIGEPQTAQPRERAGIGLDVQINAPTQIFVRGRGLDVEVGGSVRLRGTTTGIQPVGQFELRRGRLLVLGQRIEFDEGSVQLVGNLDPLLNFVARTQSGDVIAIVTVTGRASAPEITFTSEPPLPQDEVLARVLFNRATGNLSPFQVAQLAAAAAELAGGGGPGILSQLRGATGLDTLDIITEEGGATAVQAGKYLDENLYLTLQTDTEGLTQAEINLDISDRVTARGSLASDGNTTIGIFYERDY